MTMTRSDGHCMYTRFLAREVGHVGQEADVKGTNGTEQGKVAPKYTRGSFSFAARPADLYNSIYA